MIYARFRNRRNTRIQPNEACNTFLFGLSFAVGRIRDLYPLSPVVTIDVSMGKHTWLASNYQNSATALRWPSKRSPKLVYLFFAAGALDRCLCSLHKRNLVRAQIIQSYSMVGISSIAFNRS
jgi:hypothetical protein